MTLRYFFEAQGHSYEVQIQGFDDYIRIVDQAEAMMRGLA